MVRNICGTLLEIGRGNSKGSMARILESRNRKLAGPALPAQKDWFNEGKI